MTVDAATLAQIRAAAPDASSWVAANAGSGKTRVLTDRVARLLLRGVDPASILCLTYTKAAANEMQNRLFRRLGEWAMMPDDTLREKLSALGDDGLAVEAGQLARARTLFAQALEAPGGLRIQTIHAFCDRLLRLFPLEAGVSPAFDALSDEEAAGLRDTVLEGLADGEDTALFDAIATEEAGVAPDALVSAILSQRGAFAGAFPQAGLKRAFGVTGTESLAELEAGILNGPALALLARLLPVLSAGSSNDIKAAGKLRAMMNRSSPEERLFALEGIFLYGETAQKGPFSAKVDAFPTKDTREKLGPDQEVLNALMRQVEAGRQTRLAIRAYQRAEALHSFARAFLDNYAAAKAMRGRLDYQDLIDRTVTLLRDSASAAWVLWRLDGGISHVLVDEAQDTSPAQWEVIAALTSEFFVGAGAHDRARTIFVVGDEKQSIYSFQGADPAIFGQMRDSYGAALEDVNETLENCALNFSFRSAPQILALVDQVFAMPGVDPGRITDARHSAFHSDMPGRVELWPQIPAPEKPEEAAWYEPVDTPPKGDAQAQLARRIATHLAGLVAARQFDPSEIMILFRRRSPLFHAVIRALKAEGLAVSGPDRLSLTDALAVKDILATLAAIANSDDDLSLAAALRSPLFDVSEAALYELATGRTAPLWQRVAGTPAGEVLHDLAAQADFLRPHEMLQRLLVHHDGRRRLVARLGAEVEDVIDVLLDRALAYEADQSPSLTGFLAWMQASNTEVKRQLGAGGTIRVMTVHGAKGLEAGLVVLPDTGKRSQSGKIPAVQITRSGVPVWRLRGEAQPPPIADADDDWKVRQQQEEWRLLYVALTRAERQLIVCAASDTGTGTDSWHAAVASAMEALGAEPDGDALVLGDPPRASPADPSTDPADMADPDWLQLPAPPPLSAAVRLAPSTLGGARSLQVPPEDDDVWGDGDARARGTALHLLLETLPDVPTARRGQLAGQLVPDGTAQEVIDEALALIDDPDFAPLFAPETLREVSVSADPRTGPPIYGQIDRLLVTDTHVVAIDFKSNRQVPTPGAAPPDALLRQMAAYWAALTAIWPQKMVSARLVWTRTRTVTELDAPLLARVWAGIVEDGGIDPGRMPH